MTAEEEPTQAPAVEDNAADAEQKPERKQFVKRLPRPDQAELKAKVESLEATITAQKQRVESIRSELDGRNRRRANDTESQGIRNQLQELRTQFQQVLVRVMLPPCDCCCDRRCSSFMPTRARSGSRLHSHRMPGLVLGMLAAAVLNSASVDSEMGCIRMRILLHTALCFDNMLMKHVVQAAAVLLSCCGRVRREPWAPSVSIACASRAAGCHCAFEDSNL